MPTVKIGKDLFGDGQPCYVIAEIGINHNGDVELAKKLIDVGRSGRLQRGQIPEADHRRRLHAGELARPRESPFGETNGDLKRGLEFGFEAYREIDRLLPGRGHFVVRLLLGRGLGRFHRPVRCALLQDRLGLVDRRQPAQHTRSNGKPIILSTGMSTLDQIDHAVEVLGTKDLILMHSCSTYPAYYEELNLRTIPTLRSNATSAGRLFGPRDGHPVVGGRRRPRRLLRRAAHHPRPLHVGLRSGRLARAQRHHPACARHPPGGNLDGRRREARSRREVPVMQKLRRVGK